MIITHAINSDNLQKVLANGYFLCPSLALTTKENCLCNYSYGDITVIFSDNITNPEKNKDAVLLSGDGYTVTVNPWETEGKPKEKIVELMKNRFLNNESFIYYADESACKSAASVSITMEEAEKEINRIVSLDEYRKYKEELIDRYEVFLDKNFKGWDSSNTKQKHLFITPYLEENSIAPSVQIGFKAAIKASAQHENIKEKQKAIEAACNKYGLKVTKKKIDNIIDFEREMRKAPIVYFEEKIFQAVPLSEVKGIVLPDTPIHDKLIKQLQENDILYKCYSDNKTREKAIIAISEMTEQEHYKYKYDIKQKRMIRTDGQHLTGAQEEYFKDSVLRNQDGELVQCFHYTDHQFDAFDKNFITDDSFCGRGFYFTSMTTFGSGFGKNTLECYINMKNPLVVEDLEEYDKEDLLRYFAQSEDYFNGYLPRLEGFPQRDEEYQSGRLIDMLEYSDFDNQDIKDLVEQLTDGCWYHEFLSSKNIEDLRNSNEFQELMKYDEFKSALEERGLDDYVELDMYHTYDLTGTKFHMGYWNSFSQQLTDWAKEKGYDGILSESSVNNIIREIVVFEPNQIKLVDNLYPTNSDNFRDNSAEYLLKYGDKLPQQERDELYHIVQQKSEKDFQICHQGNNKESKEYQIDEQEK